MQRKLLSAALVLFFAVTITGCSTEVPLTAAPEANSPDCANVTVRLPAEISGNNKRATNAQATGAWGDPAAVILRCGLAASKPTTTPCISVNNIDWIIDDSKAPLYRFETYGRNPNLEVFIDSEKLSGTNALLELAPAVALLEQNRKCLSYRDTITDN